MKRFVAILLSLVLMMSLSLNINAQSEKTTILMGLSPSNETLNYANQVFDKHINIMFEVGDLTGNKTDYSLGSPVTVFNVVNNTYSFDFPVITNNNIVAILEISENKGEFNSSLSVSFATEITKIFDNKDLSDVVLLTDGVVLQAYDGKHSVNVYMMYAEKTSDKNLGEKFDLNAYDLTSRLSLDDLLSPLVVEKRHVLRGIDRPTSHRTLGVQGVSQVGNTCWAATCAAIINYYKGSSLSAVDVARYVFGNSWNQGGSWTNMKQAYNHWGLYPSQTGVVSFVTVKNTINSGNPMHLRLSGNVGHSVGLIGYEDWVGSSSGSSDRILILLEPNGGVHRSVSLNSSGNFIYELGGKLSWANTIKF